MHFHLLKWLTGQALAFSRPDWSLAVQILSASLFIGSTVIHDKRQQHLAHVTQILKCESSSFALPQTRCMEVLNSGTQSCW